MFAFIYQTRPNRCAAMALDAAGGAHGADERLSVENVGRMARGHAQLMMMVAGE
ncbi:MAG: hypothetical protein AAGB25_02420 [Pseudomonadota bacterium]